MLPPILLKLYILARNKTRIKTIRGAAEYSIRQDAPGDKLELTRIAALAPRGIPPEYAE